MFLLQFTDRLVCAYLCAVVTYVFPWKLKKCPRGVFFSAQAPGSNIRTFIHQIIFPCTIEVKIG